MIFEFEPSQTVRVTGNAECHRLTFVRFEPDGSGGQAARMVWENCTLCKTSSCLVGIDGCHDVPGMVLHLVRIELGDDGHPKSAKVNLGFTDSIQEADFEVDCVPSHSESDGDDGPVTCPSVA